MFITVVEVLAPDQRTREQIRRILGRNIRDGDGLASEINRLFLILATAEPSGAKIAVDRLQPKIGDLGGRLEVKPNGSDPIADSVRRRAMAGFLPVAMRIAK